jgi:hypothetical protein
LGKTFTFSGKAIRQEKGHCFTVTLPGTEHIADRSESPLQSPARIFENERPLGPAHAQHDYIRAVGEGAYSHWGGTLYFSSSDKSDPRTNNKKYRVEC